MHLWYEYILFKFTIVLTLNSITMNANRPVSNRETFCSLILKIVCITIKIRLKTFSNINKIIHLKTLKYARSKYDLKSLIAAIAWLNIKTYDNIVCNNWCISYWHILVFIIDLFTVIFSILSGCCIAIFPWTNGISTLTLSAGYIAIMNINMTLVISITVSAVPTVLR